MNFEKDKRILHAFIKYASEIEKMSAECIPLLVNAPHSKSAESYVRLWTEISERIG